MAVRSDCRASSGLTSKAGGHTPSARCSVGQQPRQFRSGVNQANCGSAARAHRAGASSLRHRRFLVSTAGALVRDVDQPLIELAAVLTDCANIGPEFCCSSAALFCCARVSSSSCSRCLIRVGRSGCRLARRACDLGCRRQDLGPPPARLGLPPAKTGLPRQKAHAGKARGQQGDRKAEYGLRIADRDERCQSMNECLALPALNPDQCFQSFHWRGSNAVIGVAANMVAPGKPVPVA